MKHKNYLLILCLACFTVLIFETIVLKKQSLASCTSEYEALGDKYFSKKEYGEAVDFFGKSLKDLGLDVNIFYRLERGALPQLECPYEAALLIIKWSRALQREIEQTFLHTAYLSKTKLLAVVYAASAAANIMEYYRVRLGIDDAIKAKEISRFLRQAYDIKIEIVSLFGHKDPEFSKIALLESNRSRARSLMDIFLEDMAGSYDSQFKLSKEEYWLHVLKGTLEEAILAENQLSNPRQKIINDLKAKLQNTNKKLKNSHVAPLSLEQRTLPDFVSNPSGWMALGFRQGILQYHSTARLMFAILLLEDDIKIEIKLVDLDVPLFEKKVNSYLRKLRDPNERYPWKKEANEFYKLLIAPFEEKISKLDHLFIVPSGPLSNFPFSTLYDSKSGKLLLDIVKFSLLPHMNFIAKTQSIEVNSIMAVGINEFSNENQLAYGEKEALELKSIFRYDARLFLGSNHTAVKNTLLRNFPNYDLIHFSSHAVADVNPMLSYLVAQDTNGNDAKITALDIIEYSAPLKPGLVVLSACNTGEVDAGETDDIMGLLRAFLMSGSLAVIASLWPIEQESMYKMFLAFYAVFSLGDVSSSLALQTVQSEMSKSKRYWNHPHFWGAINIYGDGRFKRRN